MSLKTWAFAGIAARVLGLLDSLQDLGANLVAAAEERLLALRRGVRAEVRLAATAFALALVGAVCGLAALGFVAAAVMLAVGEAHRVLAALLLAVLFAVVAVWAVIGVRANTR
jgi:uncharacterized membrane protein